MEKVSENKDWQKYIPIPVCDDHPEYLEFYKKAWELAHDHVRCIPGMPQSPYMDEALCDTQVWIWDSCFMALFCKYAPEAFPGVETLENFYGVLYGGKALPKIIPSEHEPVWTKATPGQPSDIYVHIADNPPLFAWAEYENALMRGDKKRIEELLYGRAVLQKHYEWIEGLREKTKLPGVFLPTCLISEKYGYKWEGGCSGMDNTPRGRTGERSEGPRPNNPNMLWIDAICQQAFSARLISKLYGIVGDSDGQSAWLRRFEEKRDIVNRFYWHKKDRFYYDIDNDTLGFYKVKSIASYWPLTAGIATTDRAEAMADYITDGDSFGGTVPFVSLSRSDNDYCPDGRYWRGSVWLPTAYAALKGLCEYGYYKTAHDTSHKLFRHMLATYNEYLPHSIWECYSPEEHRPACSVTADRIVRKDFCGWSALGPISVYIEFVLGFHYVNAFEGVVEWERPDAFKGRTGIKNLRFGSVVTDIVAEGRECTVVSNAPYRLCVCGTEYNILPGENRIIL